MDVFQESLHKFNQLMQEKGPEQVVEEFQEFKDDSGVFMPKTNARKIIKSYLTESFVILDSYEIAQESLKTKHVNVTVKATVVADEYGQKTAFWNVNGDDHDYDWAA